MNYKCIMNIFDFLLGILWVNYNPKRKCMTFFGARKMQFIKKGVFLCSVFDHEIMVFI